MLEVIDHTGHLRIEKVVCTVSERSMGSLLISPSQHIVMFTHALTKNTAMAAPVKYPARTSAQ